MRTFLIAILLLTACETRRPENIQQVTAANKLTRECSRSRLSRWDLRASAAGKDCAVLLVQTSIVLDDSLVEALHYGAGAYDVPEGGVQQFFRKHGFRGVTYRDSSQRVWSYGAVSQKEETEELPSCE
ncbi:MAG TPA: hypothetical protein VEK57_20680 [Thermoanaerobaculia bacterium]|nr:hypothetical protein [Thermoanaerobaculia bacterium]